MKKMIWSIVIGLLLIAGSNIDEAVAQSPPNIKVSLAFNPLKSRLQNRLLYLAGDPIEIVLSFQNRGEEEITSKGFRTKPFHLFLVFTGPDGQGIIATKFEEGSTGDDAPPPPVVPVEDVQGRVELLQVEPVEKINAGWKLTVTLPNAHAYYTLSNPGNYSVKAVIPMRTYLGIDQTIDSVDYSNIDRYKWKDALQSNTEYFTLVADKDNDGYSYPVAVSPPYNALPDCNDNDPNEHPGQTWYKDLDNDGYSDGTTNTESCTRPPGYKVASELIALSGDCDDNNFFKNPGRTEVVCNGIDDDCNSATPDFPAPTLASPANGATNVSTAPTLSWSGISCATSYGVQVATDSQFSSVVINQTVTGTSFTVSTPLSNNTTYYWRVNATKSGETSAWSPPRSFITTTIKTHLLIVTKIGIGSGNVTASPGTLIWYGIIGTATYNHNTTVTLTATPSTDSTFNGWYAFCLGPEGCSVTINGSKCTLTMCGPCFANATFMLKTYTITSTAGTGGSISPSGSVKVNHGANKTFTITPNTGYQILDVMVDNVSKGAIKTYTFTNVTANHTISATFKATTPTAAVRPMLECVRNNGNGTYTAYFGYLNENPVPVTITVGSNNKFTPNPQNRGQTTVFQPGRIENAFSVVFDGNNLVWYLKGPDGQGRTSTASHNSSHCK